MTDTKPGRGGARPGAGRPKKERQILPISAGESPLDFLILVMNCESADLRLRIDAARAALPYMHQKGDALGKKDIRKVAAHRASGGRFAPGNTPRLLLVNK